LTDQDNRYLRGERGTGAALAMRAVLAVAASMAASRLVDIESAHVDGCFYVGSVSIDFAQALVDGDARVSVPTTLNVGSFRAGDQPRVGIDSRTAFSRARHSPRRSSSAPRGSCAACLSGAHTRSNNSRRTEFDYGSPLGMTTSKSTEVALPVGIRLA